MHTLSHILKSGTALLLALALLFCAAAAEDTAEHFLPLVEGTVEPLPIDLQGGYAPKATARLSETEYADASISVRLEEHEVNSTRCILAYVTIADPSQLRTAPAYDFNRSQVATTEKIANRMKAVVAMSGDYYSYWKEHQGGYMIRQDQMYMDSPIKGRDCLLIDDQGNFHIAVGSDRAELDALMEQYHIVNTLNFGPGLVVEGQCLAKDYVASFCQSNEQHQRAAICQMSPDSNQYVLAVCEGTWMNPGTGLTIVEWAQFLAELGVYQAYNLDGGNSSALIFGGKKVNEPGNPHHRELSDIIYFASADPS